jgi:Rrf2 family protein
LLITRETDYALRALRALGDGEKKTLAKICEEELIPQQFGYKILKKLASDGYVQIRRGKEGGYIIGKEVAQKSLYDLTKILDTDPDVTPCIKPDYKCSYKIEHKGHCKVHDNLRILQNTIDSELKAVKLSNLLAEE